ncbi:MAG: DEAD/DEAH box helicase [Flavobacteriales bacterium]|jgi:ATP-dependent RNA helicase RhlE|tara:strand:- start:5526 stop:6656 length:1131 start_codon:yes stop_codon:yes gene_type:complete
MPFSSLGLPKYFQEILIQENYTKPYPIQEAVIPAVLSNHDILGIAQTGSGKTAGYVLPLLTSLKGVKTSSPRHISVLVLVPTRELAIQVDTVFRQFGQVLPFKMKSMAIYGGTSKNVQMMRLSNAKILIATPGRLLDLLSSNSVQLSEVKTLVLDEADKILNLGFKKEMDEIFSFLPKKRQNLLFSATLSPNIENIQQVLLNDPLVIQIEPEKESIELIKQIAYSVSDEQKGPLLRHLIKSKNIEQVLVFTSSVHQADVVTIKLNKHDIQARAIHGKKSQGFRVETLGLFKAGKLRVLVATDLLARGVDIQTLPVVINYELPRSPKDYVHRIGRTGRAKNHGEAISFISEDAEHHFKIIQKKMKKTVEVIPAHEIL